MGVQRYCALNANQSRKSTYNLQIMVAQQYKIPVIDLCYFVRNIKVFVVLFIGKQYFYTQKNKARIFT